MKLNSNLPEVRNEVAVYVSDMAKMELSAFTLDKMAEDCLDRGQKIEKTAQEQFLQKRRDVMMVENELNEALNELQAKNKEFDKINNIANRKSRGLLGSLFSAFLKILWSWVTIVIVVGSIVISAILGGGTITFEALVGAGIVLILIFLVSMSYYYQHRDKKEERQLADKRNEAVKESAKSVNRVELKLKGKKDELEKNKKLLDIAIGRNKILMLQAEEHRKASDEIRTQLKKCYALGVVPPDYRTIDCVIFLDKIFQSKQVQTMREAIKLYEEQVFRGELQKGVDKIYNEWNKLSDSMRYMRSAMESVRNTVSLMGQDMVQVSQDAAINVSRQKQILAETKSTRYAVESMQIAQERCEWYLANND